MTRIAGIAAFFVLMVAMGREVAPTPLKSAPSKPTDEISTSRVEDLLARMTLEEKIGQMSQWAWGSATGPANNRPGATEDLIARGGAGSLLNVVGAAATNRFQKIAVERSRLGIPLLFGYDTIHGYRTIFPVPLALAGTFDPTHMRASAAVGARESTAAGVNWVFAPMLDVSRDPRWGRIVESGGEAPLLNRVLAEASIAGTGPGTLSCPKHFAAYGAAEAGRDYNTVDMSEGRLRDVYLPPFAAAIRAGAGSVMAGFHDLNGVPAHANSFLLRRVLREEWGFEGIVVSDYNGIRELIAHGVAKDAAEAAARALKAGIDMDMEGGVYAEALAKAVRSGVVPLSLVDASVRRILTTKEKLGLFEHPYRNEATEAEAMVTKESRHAALEAARAAIVLLKNDGNVLPLGKGIKRLLVVGPLADRGEDCLGPWHGQGEARDAVSVLAGIRRRATGRGITVEHAMGVELPGSAPLGVKALRDAVVMARRADVVVAVVGEPETMSGEAASRSDLGLPGRQDELLAALKKTGTPMVAVLMNGRPLVLPWLAQQVPAVLESWFLGVEHGNAVADVLFGDVNPAGRLAATFPRSLGQVPLHHAARRTGRPADAPQADAKYVSKYLDVANTPLWPFGHGLSYTRFAYEGLQVRPKKISADPTGRVLVSVTVRNLGERRGDEVVQVYVRDDVASVTRPRRQLAGFRRVSIDAGAAERVDIELSVAELGFYDEARGQHFIEPGTFTLWVGPSSAEGLSTGLELAPAR